MPAQTEEGRFSKVHATKFLEEVLGHLLEDVDDVVLLYKTHLAVNLREFRLTVGAEVFVSETLDNLEITVHACHHQQLLQRLRRLWEGIELSGIHAAGYDEVACALGGRADEHGGLDFEESFAVEEMAYRQTEFVA